MNRNGTGTMAAPRASGAARSETMRAIAVRPKETGTLHLATLPRPQRRGPRDVLVQVLRVGVDGTDKEICAGEYGRAPAGSDILVLGHESFGRVVEVGPEVRELAPGDLVVATVRRPGSSLYDTIGTYDMTSDTEYFERGISRVHGFLTEYYVEDPEYLVLVPPGLVDTGVLMEPTSVVEKGIAQAFEIQRRLRVWRPRRAAVLGAGTIGLLATMVLRLRGLEVTTFGRTMRPYRNAELIEGLGARYVSTAETPLLDFARADGAFDLIFEASGFSPLVFEGMQALAKNGVLVLSSVTGGDRTVEVPADRINLDFVLGNKVVVGTVNANREYFELGVRDHAQAVAQWPGWLERLVTHRVRGLDAYEELFATLTRGADVIKVVCEVAEA